MKKRRKRKIRPGRRLRLEQYALLWPEREAEAVAREADRKLRKNLLACLLGTLILAGAAAGSALLSEDTVSGLTRPAPGEAESAEVLIADYEGETVPVEIPVGSRSYTAAEKEAVLDRAEAEMRRIALAGNRSADDVTADLDLYTPCQIKGVEAEWTVPDPDLLHSDGRLKEDLSYGQGRETTLKLRLTFEGSVRESEVRLTLKDPPEETGPGAVVAAAVAAEEEKTRDEATVALPAQIGGEPVTFRREGTGGLPAAILLLGLTVGAALLYLPKQRLKEAGAKRSEELALAYPELTSKLAVLTGAGLSVRRAWEKMAADYEKKRAEGGKRQALYEEMRLSLRLLGQGYTEEEVYAKFAERIGLVQYLRFGAMLESQRKNGRSGLQAFLAEESAEAFRERLRLARQRGEKISSRLMLPMMLLFALVLAMLIVPAFLTL